MSVGELRPLLLELRADPGPLLPQIRAALAAEGRALRWAITGAESEANGQRRLRIEAVLLCAAAER